jgi:hypothetical protein
VTFNHLPSEIDGVRDFSHYAYSLQVQKGSATYTDVNLTTLPTTVEAVGPNTIVMKIEETFDTIFSAGVGDLITA